MRLVLGDKKHGCNFVKKHERKKNTGENFVKSMGENVVKIMGDKTWVKKAWVKTL